MLPRGVIEKAARAMKKGKGLQVLSYMSMIFESSFLIPLLMVFTREIHGNISGV